MFKKKIKKIMILSFLLLISTTGLMTSFLNNDEMNHSFEADENKDLITSNVPAAPNLDEIASPNSNSRIKINWSDVPGTEYYLLYRSDSYISNPSNKVPVYKGSISYFYDTIDCPGLYYYTVIASNSSGTSAHSNNIDVYFSGNLTTPVLSMASTSDTRTNVISWSSSSTATGYALYRDTSEISNVDLMNPIYNGSSTSFTDTILEDDVYYYTIFAYNENDYSGLAVIQSIDIQTVHRQGYAVCIGISDYPGYYNDLTYCDDDAYDVRSLLHSRFSMPYSNIKLLTDSSATSYKITNAVNDIASQMTSDDYLVFQYSGHGTNSPSYSICVYDEYISWSELDQILDVVPGKVIILLDSCHSGGVGSYASQTNRHFICASRSYEYSLEDTGRHNGVFTYSFLTSWGSSSDANGDGVISFEEIFQEIYDETVSRSAYIGYTHHPTRYDSISGETNLSPNAHFTSCYDTGTGKVRSNYYLDGLGQGTMHAAYYDIQNQDYVISYSENSIIPTSGSSYTEFDKPGSGFSSTAFTTLLKNNYYSIECADNYSIYLDVDRFTDTDSDGDGLTDIEEFYNGINPWNNDTDSDGMADGYECSYNLDPLDPTDKNIDSDNDGLLNINEFIYETNAQDFDTDNDGLSDFEEIYVFSTDPTNPDTDNDLLNDGDELIILFTDVFSNDTDLDGMTDGWEYDFGLDPLDNSDNITDSDLDGIVAYYEFGNSTNPNNNDTDGDNLNDYDEICVYNTNPASDDTDSDGMTDDWELFYSLNPLSNLDNITDPDLDGLINVYEYGNSTNPNDDDSDDDLLLDGDEILIYFTNPNSNDTDLDLLDDYTEQITYGTNATFYDTDNDGLPDFWEILMNTNVLVSDSSSDPDNDGMTNLEEYLCDSITYESPWNYASTHSYYTSEEVSISNNNDSNYGQVNVSVVANYGDHISELIIEYNTTTQQNMMELVHICPGSDTNSLSYSFIIVNLSSINIYCELHEESASAGGYKPIEINSCFFNITANPMNNDTDYDSMPDKWEYDNNLLINDGSDNCTDHDFDGLLNVYEYGNSTDPWDNDTDDDALNDYDEIAIYFTNASSSDTDLDSMPDGWEVENSLNPLDNLDNITDPDIDGLINVYEYGNSTDPNDDDCDDDLLLDGDEVITHLTNPNSNDTDFDLLGDYDEILTYGTDALNYDTDTDNIPDFWEIMMNTNALVSDSSFDPDNDGMTNLEEYRYGSIQKNPQGSAPNGGYTTSYNLSTSDTNNSDYVEFEVSASQWSDDFISEFIIGYNTTSHQEIIELIHVYPGSGTISLSYTFIMTNVSNVFAYCEEYDTAGNAGGSSEILSINAYFFNITSDPLDNDTDNDSMPDGWEYDNDLGLNDGTDNCTDGDIDGIINLYEFGNSTDPWDNDTDDDTLNDYDEICLYLTNPLSSDTDLDAMPDGWEIQYALNPNDFSDNTTDIDSDLLINLYEFGNSTNPRNNDTDNDMLDDYVEIVTHSTDPLCSDSDIDNLSDYEEVITYGTNPNDYDSDDDTMIDYWEVLYQLNPLFDDRTEDSDNDGLTNYEEYAFNRTYKQQYTPNGGYYTHNQLNFTEISDGDYLILEVNAWGWTDDYISQIIVSFFNLTSLQWEDILRINPSSSTTSYSHTFWIENTNETSIYFEEYDTSGSAGGGSEQLYAYLYIANALNPNNSDTDSDNMPDGWEIENELDPCCDDAALDYDTDSLTNLEEFNIGTLANKNDTDNDNLTDYLEFSTLHSNPLSNDTDGDRLTDGDEYLLYLTNVNNADSDDDGLNDYDEIMIYRTNPNKSDSDGDGYSDYEELQSHSDPLMDISNPMLPIFLGIIFACCLTFIFIGSSIIGKKTTRPENFPTDPKPKFPSQIKTIEVKQQRSSISLAICPYCAGLVVNHKCSKCGRFVNF